MEKYYWSKLTAQIVLVFIVAIIASFIPDYLHTFFGDVYHSPKEICYQSGLFHYAIDEPHYHWGWRHMLWCMMGVAVMIVQIFRVGAFISKNNS